MTFFFISFFSTIAIQLLIHLSSEIIAGRRSDSRSRKEQINCPTKQLRLTWHVVCLPSAEFPEQTFQFPFPSAGRVMKGRGRLEVVVGFIHSSFLSSHTLKSTASLEERKRRKKEKEKKKSPHALSSHIHQQECLVSQRKSECYHGRQHGFPCGRKMSFVHIKCCWYTASCCWVRNLLTHTRRA